MTRIMMAGVVMLGIAGGRGTAQERPRETGDKPQIAAILDLRLKRERVEYAINDEKAAKAAAEEAKSRAVRDKAAYDVNAISAAELSTSLAAKEKFFHDYLAKGTTVKLARHDFEQAAFLFFLKEAGSKGAEAQRSIEIFKALLVVQEKQLKVAYAIDDEKAAKAAAEEAKSRTVRDKAAYDINALSAAELSASLAAKEKFFYDYLAKGIAVKIGRIELEQAKLWFKLKAGSLNSEPPQSLLEFAKSLAALREQERKFQQAVEDEQAAKVAANEAKSRHDRDKAAYSLSCLSWMEYNASFLAMQRLQCGYLVRVYAIPIARTELERARTLCAVRLRSCILP